MTAPDVGNARAALQLRLDSFEGWNPGAREIRRVARAKKTLRTDEQLRIVLMPADALACLERVRDLVDRTSGRQRNLKSAGQKCRAVVVGQRERLLFRQAEPPARLVVRDVSARGLRGQPLANISFGRSSFLGELRWRHRTRLRERFVKTQSISDGDQGRVHRGTKIDNSPAEQLIELLHV